MFLIKIFMLFSLKGNWIHIHITFPFLAVRFLLFQNSSGSDVHSFYPFGGLKNKKVAEYGVEVGLLKRGAWHFSCLIFSRFLIFTFRNYFTQNCVTLDFFLYKELRILSRTRVAYFRDRNWYWSCLNGCLNSSCAIRKHV